MTRILTQTDHWRWPGGLSRAVLQLLFQVCRFWLRFKAVADTAAPDRKHEAFSRIMTLMLPALFGVSVSQIQLAAGSVCRSMETGSILLALLTPTDISELPLGALYRHRLP